MFLEKTEIFRGLPSEVLEKVSRIAVEEHHDAGKVLFHGGDPAKDLYLLVDGQVAITVENTDFTYPVDEAGGVFGWSALGQSRRYTATAQLTMESTLLRLDGERLMAVFEEHPREGMLVFQRLLSVVSGRLESSYARYGRPRG